MPDNENGQLPVEETTTPMPSENKPDSEVSETPQTEESLPEGVSERTKEQFEKLKEANKEMAKKLEILEKVNHPEEPKLSVLELLRGIPQKQESTVEPIPPKEEVEDETLIDENGYLDEARLKQGLTKSQLKAKEAEERAKKAQQQAEEALRRVEEYELTSEKKRTHSDFPEIDPYSPKFNQELYNQVGKDVLWNMVNVGQENFYETTAKVVGKFRLGQSGYQQKLQEQQEQTERLKNEAQNPGRSGAVSQSRHEELMQKIQQPKQAGLDALTELMRDY